LGALRGRVVLLLVVLLMAVRLVNMAVHETYDGPGPLGVTRDLVVPAGGTARAAAALERAGAWRQPFVFRLAAWMTRGDGPVRAGEFVIPAHASLARILDILRHGAPIQHQVTIPEGLTGVQIAKILNAAPDAAGVVAAPADGAVLPQTYDFTLGTKRAAILARAEAAMGQAVSAVWAKREAGIPLGSPREAVILASIVQEESPIGAELPEIAAVYENRLARGMKLQADPTVIYAASGGQVAGGVPISRAELAADSPYNTYVVAGLPPGPICAPGMAALNAVLHPADSDALYFVATGNGGHVFARDFAGQLRNIENYRGRRKPNYKL
jgi:UPF0755 protein